MKSKTTILVLFFALASAFAQEAQKPLATIGNHRIGGYIGLSAKAASVFDQSAAFGDARIGASIDGKWIVGLAASGLDYDKKLDRLVSDGTYRFYAGFTGIFVERLFMLGESTKLALSLTSGSGLAYYRYDKDYRAAKVWSEEIIDGTRVFVNEPAIEIQHRIGGKVWLGLIGSYRLTSEVDLIGASKDELRGLGGGLSIKYAIY